MQGTHNLRNQKSLSQQLQINEVIVGKYGDRLKNITNQMCVLVVS